MTHVGGRLRSRPLRAPAVQSLLLDLELLGAAEEVRGDDPREGEAAGGAVGGSLARGALVLPAALGHLVLVGDLVHEAGLRGPGTLQSEGDGDGMW